MTYTINENGLAEIAKLKRKRRTLLTVGLPVIIIVVLLASSDARRANGSLNIGKVIFNVSMGTVFFNVFITQRRKKISSVLRNIISEITIDENAGVFKLLPDSEGNIREILFIHEELRVSPVPKAGFPGLKDKDFILFSVSSNKLFFVDEYWDEPQTILETLTMDDRGVGKVEDNSEDEFSLWLNNEEQRVRDLIYYDHPIKAFLLLLVVILSGVHANMSLLAISIGSLLILFFFIALAAYPSFRTAKLLNHLVKKMEIRDGYCYMHCRSIYSGEPYYKAYALEDISIGEWEVYHERFFKGNRFMVLDAKEDKYYLMGDVLEEKEAIFRKG